MYLQNEFENFEGESSKSGNAVFIKTGGGYLFKVDSPQEKIILAKSSSTNPGSAGILGASSFAASLQTPKPGKPPTSAPRNQRRVFKPSKYRVAQPSRSAKPTDKGSSKSIPKSRGSSKSSPSSTHSHSKGSKPKVPSNKIKGKNILNNNGNGNSGGSSSNLAGPNQCANPDFKKSKPQHFYGQVQNKKSKSKSRNPNSIETFKTDFTQVLDKNRNPDLLVPNDDSKKTTDKQIRVEHEQTKTHLHHAEDLGIDLPDDFDIEKYINMTPKERIKYADQKVDKAIVVKYQNEIGKAMVGKNTIHVLGCKGKFKEDVQIKVQIYESAEKSRLTIIEDKTLKHISTFNVTKDRLIDITKDDFWIWKKY